MSRHLFFAYGLVSYVLFLGTFLYLIGFVAGIPGLPRTVDAGGPATSPLAAAGIDLVLVLLFALQHGVMARPAFKARWTRFVPPPIERSTFVLVTNVVLWLLFWQWHPLPTPVWEVESGFLQVALWTVAALGWGTVLIATFQIDHFDLFGLRQVWLHWRGRAYDERPFTMRGFYRWCRHPLMLGFLVAFWSTPVMTRGHLLFAAAMTAMVLAVTRLEERTLEEVLGDDYREYRRRTPAFLPLPPWTRERDRTACQFAPSLWARIRRRISDPGH